MSARIGGVREHHGTIAGTAEWSSIISAEDSAGCGRSCPTRPGAPPEHPAVTSSPVCFGVASAAPGSSLDPAKGGPARYLCASGPGIAGCGKTYIVAPDLEAWITEAVMIRLDSPALAKALEKGDQSSEAGELADELADDTAQLDELAEAYGSKAITLSEWLAARKPIEARIEHERKRLLAHVSHQRARRLRRSRRPALQNIWPDLPLDSATER